MEKCSKVQFTALHVIFIINPQLFFSFPMWLGNRCTHFPANSSLKTHDQNNGIFLKLVCTKWPSFWVNGYNWLSSSFKLAQRVVDTIWLNLGTLQGKLMVYLPGSFSKFWNMMCLSCCILIRGKLVLFI